MKTQFSKFF